MSEESREHLSCLMDGEISRDTSRFLVRRLGADEELCATWARYHLVRDCLRHHEGGLVSNGLSAKVRQAIENEQVPSGAVRRGAAWLKPAAGLAVPHRAGGSVCPGDATVTKPTISKFMPSFDAARNPPHSDIRQTPRSDQRTSPVGTRGRCHIW